MFKIAFQFTLLMAVIIFLILLFFGMPWQISLMRTSIAMVVLMILFYLAILFIEITKVKQPINNEE